MQTKSHKEPYTYTLTKREKGKEIYIYKKENIYIHIRNATGGAVVENLPANAGDMGSSPGLGRSQMLWSN